MAIVGSVYSSAPNIRTVEDIITSLFSSQSSPNKEARIKPLNKRVRASLRRIENAQEVRAVDLS